MSEKFNGLPVSIVCFDADGKVTGEENYNLDKVEPDPWALKGLAGALLPHIQEFYSHEENVRAFEAWQREQSVEQKPSPKKRKRKAP